MVFIDGISLRTHSRMENDFDLHIYRFNRSINNGGDIHMKTIEETNIYLQMQIDTCQRLWDKQTKKSDNAYWMGATASLKKLQRFINSTSCKHENKIDNFCHDCGVKDNEDN